MQATAVKDAAFDVLLFPVWWYSRGLVFMLRFSAETMLSYAKYFAIDVWMKNIFVPMFGQRDWQSRLISVFMRSVQIIGRSIGLVMIAMCVAALFVFYLIGPIAAILFGAYHVVGSLLYVL